MASIDQEHKKRREVFRLGKKRETIETTTSSTSQ
jgi:hypothetical protein